MRSQLHDIEVAGDPPAHPATGIPEGFTKSGLCALVVLAAVLPFECKDPIVRAGPLAITSVEIAIYAVVLIWAAAGLRRRRFTWTFFHTAAAIFAAVFLLSALVAATHRVEAVKFALRIMGGVVLGFACASFVRTIRSAAWIGLALAAGSLVSAAAACAEMWLPGAAKFLALFKTGPTLTGGYLRAGGTFQYANIASMYWEAALPVSLAALWWWGCRRQSRGFFWMAFGCVLLLSEAMLLAGSRAGLPIAIATLISLWAIGKDLPPPWRRLIGAGLAGILILIAAQIPTNPLLRLRLTTTGVSEWYSPEYKDYAGELTLEAGKLVRVPLTIRNGGRLTWRARGSHAVALSYHWLDSDADTILLWKGARTSLPADVGPEEAISLEAWVRGCATPGRYILQWDMVQEDVAWFSTFRSSGARAQVVIVSSTTGNGPPDSFNPVDWPLPASPERRDLWRAAVRMWRQHPLLGVGPDNFRHIYGNYLGLKNYDSRVHANSFYFETLATTGAAGMLALALLAVSIFTAVGRGWRSAADARGRILIAGIGIGIGTYWLHGVVDFFLPFTPTYGLFWILTGMAVGLESGRESR